MQSNDMRSFAEKVADAYEIMREDAENMSVRRKSEQFKKQQNRNAFQKGKQNMGRMWP